MKRYILFAGHNYYPYGGMKDEKGNFDYMIEAHSFYKAQKDDEQWEWAHVLDTETHQVIPIQERGGKIV